MAIKIALAGNPNCGKTTLFNELTGSNQYVGNWPGVTVEKKDGELKGHKDVIIQDLPGIYSLSPYSLEEVVTRRYLVNDKPDAIINIIDGTNIERNLYLTTQLLELNIPIIIAINMMDLVEKRGDKIDMEKMSLKLGCTVVPMSALNGNGCREIAEKAIEVANARKHVDCPHVFSGSVEHALAHIEESLEDKVERKSLRWFAVKVFERDEKVLAELKIDAELFSHLEEHIKDCEIEMDDDAESIITDQRYLYIQKIVAQTVQKKAPPGSLTLSDKIDRVVTNRVLALPIFAIVIWLMYWVSVSTIGTWMTDWANNGVFGDGWFLAWTKDSALFSSKEVKDRNAAAAKAFDEKAALAEINRRVAEENATAKAAWQLECARAWAADEPLPKEPAYAEREAKAAFEPETWEAVSAEYDDAAQRVEKFEEAYLKAVDGSGAFVAEAEKSAAEAAEQLAKATAKAASADDKQTAARYVKLLSQDSSEKAALLAAAKVVNDSQRNSDGDGSFRIDHPELAKLLKVPVYFEDEESGRINRAEIVGYDAYLENKKASAAENRPNPSKYGIWIPGVPGLVESFLDRIGANAFVKSLVLDGIIGGVGTVLGFLPQILVVFLFLAFLEDCGYMSRVAFIMDRILRRFGLSGKSFIPMLVGTGCGVPAVLCTRTIDNVNDRRMTIILATFIPCGAKIAIIAMITAAFFPESNLVGPSMYFLGMAIVVVGGIILKKTWLFTGEASQFVMELPAYHMPSFKSVMIHTWERGKGYALKAGTIIFSACVILWLLMHFDWRFNMLDPNSVEGLEQCMLHDIGQCFAWIFKPLGFGTWQGAVATASAEIAKEQATATLALCAPDVAGGTLKGIQSLFADMVPACIVDASLRVTYAKLIAFSFMVCNLFFPPCLVATATTWREMGSAKWGCVAIGFQLLVGYLLSFVCFRLGVFLWAGESFGIWQILAVLVILFVLYALFRPASKLIKK
ncbi:MAG: 50S ribosome-binding GTPase [Victivallales bacterium]|nr:50S ribosome-binding GTPase [Victivallales bacterium]